MWSPTPTVAPGPSYPAARKPGFFQRLSIGWKLTKVSLGVLRKEKGLVLLPFVSLLITVAVWAIFFVSMFFVVAPTDPVGSWLFYLGLAVVYSVTFFVSIYFNAAVMGAAMIRLNGGDPTISDGLKVARAPRHPPRLCRRRGRRAARRPGHRGRLLADPRARRVRGSEHPRHGPVSVRDDRRARVRPPARSGGSSSGGPLIVRMDRGRFTRSSTPPRSSLRSRRPGTARNSSKASAAPSSPRPTIHLRRRGSNRDLDRAKRRGTSWSRPRARPNRRVRACRQCRSTSRSPPTGAGVLTG